MSDAHNDHAHDHHHEDNGVNVKIAVFLVAVIAVITFIGMMN